jgi:hypothetical protein
VIWPDGFDEKAAGVVPVETEQSPDVGLGFTKDEGGAAETD